MFDFSPQILIIYCKEYSPFSAFPYGGGSFTYGIFLRDAYEMIEADNRKDIRYSLDEETTWYNDSSDSNDWMQFNQSRGTYYFIAIS